MYYFFLMIWFFIISIILSSLSFLSFVLYTSFTMYFTFTTHFLLHSISVCLYFITIYSYFTLLNLPASDPAQYHHKYNIWWLHLYCCVQDVWKHIKYLSFSNTPLKQMFFCSGNIFHLPILLHAYCLFRGTLST